MEHIGRRHVRYFNHVHEPTGALSQGLFKACPVQYDE